MKALLALANTATFGLLGEAATYTSLEFGELPVSVIPERDVEVLDDSGAYVRRTLLGVPSGTVDPATGDTVLLTDSSERFSVEGVLTDNGQVMKLRARAEA